MFKLILPTICTIAAISLCVWCVLGRANDEQAGTDFSINDVGLVAHNNGTALVIAWSEINRVGIATTDGGPWAEDVFFVIETDKGNLRIPQSKAEEIELLQHLDERLKGIDYEQVVKAMTSVNNAFFVCWKADTCVPQSATHSH